MDRVLHGRLQNVKHVVSVSLGSSKRDFCETLTLLGQEVRLERRGTDGDLERAVALIRGLDGQVDAFGLGGINLSVQVGSRRYSLRDAARIAGQAERTPVLDGGGLKMTLEKRVVERLAAQRSLDDARVFMTSALDRYGMAVALAETGAAVRYGDLVTLLGVPLPLRSLATLSGLARVVLPIARHAPFRWLYPLGDAQEREDGGPLTRFYAWADLIAGDWHLVRRHLPGRLDGKTILTNTVTPANVELLRGRGADLLVTTTPQLNGRSLPTNALEAAFVAVTGGRPLTPAELEPHVAASGLEGTFTNLSAR